MVGVSKSFEKKIEGLKIGLEFVVEMEIDGYNFGIVDWKIVDWDFQRFGLDIVGIVGLDIVGIVEFDLDFVEIGWKNLTFEGSPFFSEPSSSWRILKHPL